MDHGSMVEAELLLFLLVVGNYHRHVALKRGFSVGTSNIYKQKLTNFSYILRMTRASG